MYVILRLYTYVTRATKLYISGTSRMYMRLDVACCSPPCHSMPFGTWRLCARFDCVRFASTVQHQHRIALAVVPILQPTPSCRCFEMSTTTPRASSSFTVAVVGTRRVVPVCAVAGCDVEFVENVSYSCCGWIEVG